MDLRLVSLDLSNAATGLAHTHDWRGTPLLGCTTLHTRRNVEQGIDHQRIDHVWRDVATAVRCNPHLVTIEWLPAVTRVDPETGRAVGKGEATLRLAELHGVITQWLWAQRIPYVYVKPTYVQMWATGKGRATKRAVRAAVTATYGRLLATQIEDDNSADAVSLLSLTLAAYGRPLAEVSAAQRRALDTCGVRWPDLPWDAPTGGAR